MTSEYIAECETCGVIERGDFEDAGDAVEDHDQFHDVRVRQVATDGGQDTEEFFVVDEDRGAVVDGPYDDREGAVAAAAGRPGHIVATRGAIDLIEKTSETTVRWELDDVDIVTDGGQAQDAPKLREVTIRGYDDIDEAPMLTGQEKEALVQIIEHTDFESGFLLPEFKLAEDDHDVVRVDRDDHVDVDVQGGRLAVGYWEDYSEKAIRVTQFHRKNDPSLDTPNPGCYIPKSTTMVWELHGQCDSVETPQGRLDQFVTDGAGHVLVAHHINKGIYHRPDPDQPDRPQCDRAPIARTWRRRDPTRLPDRYRLCLFCDPDVDTTPGDREEVAATLEDLDASDVGPHDAPVFDDEDLRADGGSKYVNPTGPGYLGIVRLTNYSLKIPFGMHEGYDWQTDDDLWVVDADPGIAVVDDEPDESLATARVAIVGPSPNVKVPGRVVRRLNVGPDDDVRVYRRDDGAMRIVPADPDPMLQADGGHVPAAGGAAAPPDLDPGRDMAYLGPDVHLCEGCRRTFRDLEELADHNCAAPGGVLMTDGGTRARRYRRDAVDEVRLEADRQLQNRCRNGTEDCPGRWGDGPPCFDCLIGGGRDG